MIAGNAGKWQTSMGIVGDAPDKNVITGEFAAVFFGSDWETMSFMKESRKEKQGINSQPFVWKVWKMTIFSIRWGRAT